MKALGARAQGSRLERMVASSRFRDGTFHNTAPVGAGLKKGTGVSVVKEMVCGKDRRVPPGPLPMRSPLESWARPVQSGLRATWLGHSTVLLEIDGKRVLTDPVWGERVSPIPGIGPRRFHPAPVQIAHLPPLDAVVISHDHYDHLDHPSILRLAALDVPFVTSLGVGAHLEAWGIPADRIVELDWWESITLSGLVITAAPSQHFSGRSVGDRNRTSWSSMVMRGPHGHSVFFSGDTGLTPEYTEIKDRLGPFDLVMLEIGAFHEAWGDIHLGPANALRAHALLGGGALLPVHWSTFNLAFHAWDDPAETLVELAGNAAPLVMPRLGEAIEPAHVQALDPWWRSVKTVSPAVAVEAEEDDETPLGEPID